MDNPLFAISPLYLGVGVVIAVLVVQEYLRYGIPRRRHAHQSHRRHRAR